MTKVYQTRNDGEILAAYEYGIKFDIHGTFLKFGEIAFPVECLEDLGDPALTDAIQQAAKEFVLEKMIITIRPIGDDDYVPE